MGIVSDKLRASAKGEQCTFAIPGVCNHDSATVVLCHISDGAKGMGNKANDYSAAFGCYECHTAIDQHRLSKEDELFYSLRAMQRTWAVWISRGLIVLPGNIEKKRPKKKSNMPSRPIQSRGFEKKPRLWPVGQNTEGD